MTGRGVAGGEETLIASELRQDQGWSRALARLKSGALTHEAVSFFARTPPAVIALGLLLSMPVTADTGPQTYKAKCAACHGSKGAADSMLGRNLNLRHLGSTEVQKESDEELFAVISKGKKKRMPAYENKLSKDQIADLVKYIRSLKQ